MNNTDRVIVGLIVSLLGLYGLSFWLNGESRLSGGDVAMVIAGIIIIISPLLKKPEEKIKAWFNLARRKKVVKWSLFALLLSELILLSRYMELRHSSHLVALALQLPLIATFILYLWAHREAKEAGEQKKSARV